MFKKIISYLPQILALLFIVAFAVYAWQEPTQAPPAGNVAVPVNVSATAQTKEGDLTINGVLKTLKDMIVDTVTIKKDGSMSPNLNADKLDSYHAADLLAQSGGGGCYTHWGASTCASGYTAAYTGVTRIPFANLSGSGYAGVGVGAPICIESASIDWRAISNGGMGLMPPFQRTYVGLYGASSESCAVCCK